MQTAPTKDKAGRSGLMSRLRRFGRYWYLRLIRIQGTPHNIAIGLAAGVFVGLLPVLPFQTVLAILLALRLGGSKIAAALGTWVSNPLNWLPVYIMFYQVGKAVVPFDVPPFVPSQLSIIEIFDLGWKLGVAMLVGGLVVATPSAIIAYFVSKPIIRRYQERRAIHLAHKRQLALEKAQEQNNPQGQPLAQDSAVLQEAAPAAPQPLPTPRTLAPQESAPPCNQQTPQ